MFFSGGGEEERCTCTYTYPTNNFNKLLYRLTDTELVIEQKHPEKKRITRYMEKKIVPMIAL